MRLAARTLTRSCVTSAAGVPEEISCSFGAARVQLNICATYAASSPFSPCEPPANTSWSFPFGQNDADPPARPAGERAAAARLCDRPPEGGGRRSAPAVALPPLRKHQTLHSPDAGQHRSAVPEVPRRRLRAGRMNAVTWPALRCASVRQRMLLPLTESAVRRVARDAGRFERAGGEIRKAHRSRSESQLAAVAGVERFRKHLGPFVTVAETTRMPMRIR